MEDIKVSRCGVCGAEALLKKRIKNGVRLSWVECCGPMRHRTEDHFGADMAILEWTGIRTKAIIMGCHHEA